MDWAGRGTGETRAMILKPETPRYPAVALRREFLAMGYNDRTLARLVRRGELHRVRHGAYLTGEQWEQLDDRAKYAARCHAAQRQAKCELVLSHVSAVPAYDGPLWGLDLTTVHGTRTDGKSGRKEAGVQQHRGLLLQDDVTTAEDVLVTSPVRTCLDVTTITSTEAALCVVNHFLSTNLVDLNSLRERYESDLDVIGIGELDRRRTTRMTHWPFTLRTDLVLRLADPRCESVGESRTWYLLWRHGLPMPIPQYAVLDDRGRLVARLDFAWPEYKAFLEFDGRAKYTQLLRAGDTTADAVMREKRREDLVRELTGWRCIRITWADLANPAALAERIRRFLRREAMAG